MNTQTLLRNGLVLLFFGSITASLVFAANWEANHYCSPLDFVFDPPMPISLYCYDVGGRCSIAVPPGDNGKGCVGYRREEMKPAKCVQTNSRIECQMYLREPAPEKPFILHQYDFHCSADKDKNGVLIQPLHCSCTATETNFPITGTLEDCVQRNMLN